MSHYGRLEREALRAGMADYLSTSTEESAEIDKKLATALVALHDNKPDLYDELMSRAPALIRGFADRALAENVHGV